ncbi:hypothetical protein [Paracoccus spongiarum]|uniref:Uncharacterized protein n=1 Tax=Paracoccus spongiarum TaxID=3064387 RepID=A0ABT9JBB3_9RHOB|nr:hypothetical protein [Paracoccus sp. 2205BS29-5]MDP5307119.1 hypothetical protein [Paracoccus sp. 2205BS29-5]
MHLLQRAVRVVPPFADPRSGARPRSLKATPWPTFSHCGAGRSGRYLGRANETPDHRRIMTVKGLNMGKVVIGLVLGLAAGIGAMLYIGSTAVGIGTGAGAAMGISAGLCAMVEAANQSGVLTPEQLDTLIAQASGALAGSDAAPQTEVAGSVAQFETVMSDLRAAR